MLLGVSIDITRKGGIVIGNNIVCDGYAPKPIRIITHAHADHIIYLEDSIAVSKYICCTPATYELLKELGYWWV